MPKLAGVQKRVKLMAAQQEILKRICCDSEGATGCAVSLGTAAQLLRLGLVRLAPTRAGIEYLTGEQVLSPGRIEGWIHGFKIREGKLSPNKEKRKTKKQIALDIAIQKAEESDRLWREEQQAALQAKNIP